MAEEKKEAKKDDKKPAPSTGVSWEEVMLLILGVVALLFVALPRVFPQDPVVVTGEGIIEAKPFNVRDAYNNIFNNQEEVIRDNQGRVVQVVEKPSLLSEGKSRLTDFLQTAMVGTTAVFIFLILLFYAIIYYNKFKTDLIVAAYKKKFAPEQDLEDKNAVILEKTAPDTNGIINAKWQVVGKYYNSANQSDWKLAILEADIMLYDVLKKSGFPGDSIGEMLKNTDRSKLLTLDAAWSAHKIRNEIAHQGMNYVLSRNMVERAISQYEQVFDELNFI